MFAPMPMTANGGLDPDVISRTVKPDDEHCPISRMLTLENSWHGQVQTLGEIDAAAQCGKAHGLVVHLDGARMMNAVVKLGVTPAQMVAEADTVSVCLSKGLGAPKGHHIGRAGICDQGRIASASLLAAACVRRGYWRRRGSLPSRTILIVLPRIMKTRFASLNVLPTFPDLVSDPAAVQTNMVFVDFPEGSGIPARPSTLKKGMLIVAGSDHVRAVTPGLRN